MSLEIDDLRRRFLMKAVPGFSGAVLCQAVARMMMTETRTASYDFVLDVRDSPTGSTLADFKIVLEAYQRVSREPGLKYGCFVSTDTNYRLWATTMAALFGDRECPVFLTPEAAYAFLDRQRAADDHRSAG